MFRRAKPELGLGVDLNEGGLGQIRELCKALRGLCRKRKSVQTNLKLSVNNILCFAFSFFFSCLMLKHLHCSGLKLEMKIYHFMLKKILF